MKFIGRQFWQPVDELRFLHTLDNAVDLGVGHALQNRSGFLGFHLTEDVRGLVCGQGILVDNLTSLSRIDLFNDCGSFGGADVF